MIGDLNRDLLASESYNVRRTRALISIDGEPLGKDETPLSNKNVKYTNFIYSLRYSKDNVNGKKMVKGFLIKSDLFKNGSMRMRSYSDMLKELPKDKVLKFLFDYTNLGDKELFRLAKIHHNFDFQISVDYIKYEKNYKSKFKQAGKYYPVFFERSEAMKIAKYKDEYYKDVIKEGEKTIYDD